MVNNGKNGILVKPKEKKILSKAIEKLYLDKKFREKLSRRARTEVINNWDWSIKIKELEKIYYGIINND